MTTISEIKRQIETTSARMVIENAIKIAKENSDYNAILNFTEERALKRADDVDTGKITGELAGER